MEPNESNKKQLPKTKKKLFIVLIALLLVAALIVGYFALFTDVFKKKNEEDVTIATPTATLTPTPVPKFKVSDVKVGNTITFGSYEQDNDISNGKETIEWRVLAIEGNKALLISEYALDCQQYNTSYVKVTWETCTLRIWLNGTFLNTAFNNSEQSNIQNSKVVAEDNTYYGTDAGNDTTDKIFLLSISEANEYFSSNEDRKCVPTAYAIAQGARTSNSSTKGGKATCWWWLRSPGYYQDHASEVDDGGGSVDNFGFSVFCYEWAVRPAMWISLES